MPAKNYLVNSLTLAKPTKANWPGYWLFSEFFWGFFWVLIETPGLAIMVRLSRGLKTIRERPDREVKSAYFFFLGFF
jgi:hypothetical protein